MSASTSEFSRLFKSRFSALFRHPSHNHDEILAALVEMLDYILRGWTFPSEKVMADVRHDVVNTIIDQEFLEKIDGSQNVAAWLRTSINREIGHHLKRYNKQLMEQIPDNVSKSEPLPDKMEQARQKNREGKEEGEGDQLDAKGKVWVMAVAARELNNLEIQFAIAKKSDMAEVMQGICIAADAIQRMTRALAQKYIQTAIGSLRYTSTQRWLGQTNATTLVEMGDKEMLAAEVLREFVVRRHLIAKAG